MRRFGDLGQRNGAVGGFALHRERPRDCVVFRLDLAGCLQTLRQPSKALEIFSMNHNQRAEAAGGGKHFKNLAIGQAHRFVGHIDLERRAARFDQRGQFLPEHCSGRVRHHQMKRVVDIGFAGGAAVIVGNRFTQRLAAMLHGERDDRRGPAERRGQRTRLEVVGHHGAAGGEALRAGLIEMAVRVDAARQDEPSRLHRSSVRHRREPLGQRHDFAAADADVTARTVAGRDHRAALDHKIERGHAINPSPRLAQNVMRCSTTANSAYITMPMTAMTMRPANTRGVSKLAVAAIIR